MRRSTEYLDITGFKLVPKGKRKGYEMAWQAYRGGKSPHFLAVEFRVTFPFSARFAGAGTDITTALALMRE